MKFFGKFFYIFNKVAVDADRNVVVVDSNASANASRVEGLVVGRQHRPAAAAVVVERPAAVAAALAAALAAAVAWPTSVLALCVVG